MAGMTGRMDSRYVGRRPGGWTRQALHGVARLAAAVAAGCLAAGAAAQARDAAAAAVLASPVRSGAQALDGAPADDLPAPVRAALSAAGVPASALAAVVLRLDGGAGPPAVRLAAAAHEPRPAASLMKLFTTFAALDRLGPDWRWRTPVWLAGPVRGGVLRGSLHLAASGDPTLSAERLWLLVQAIRAQGVRDIQGDIVIDDSRFATLAATDPGAFDGEPLRPYNVVPRGLVVAQQSVLLQLRPDVQAGVAWVSALPELAGVAWPASVPLDAAAPCGDWRGALRLDLGQTTRPRLAGRYPLACGARDWPLAWPSTPDGDHARRAVEAAWRQAGGGLGGSVRNGPAPAAPPTLVFDSPPLAEVVRSINKFSNNPMARLLFLTLGSDAAEPATAAPPGGPAIAPQAAAVGPSRPAREGDPDAPRAETVAAASREPPASPATLERARRTVGDWAAERAGCRPDELVLDNGSGLSRDERTSAACLAGLLRAAWDSPLMPELLASLPVAGVDGTARRLGAAGGAGQAHLKTGSLRDVVGIAGVVLGRSGARHAVVALINDPRAPAARAALDALVAWTWDDR